MSLNEKEILHILEMFERSNWSEMQLQSGDVKLAISKDGPLPSHTGTMQQSTSAPAAAPPVSKPVAAAPAVSAAQPATVPPADPNWIPVKAPLLGHFYAAPKPGAPAFVSVGQDVTADDTIAILEVMKLMNHVKAGASGKIARIDVANGDLVEFDQVLMYINPGSDQD